MRYVPMDPFDVGSLAGIIVILVLFCLTIFEMGRPIFEESNSKVYGDMAWIPAPRIYTKLDGDLASIAAARDLIQGQSKIVSGTQRPEIR